MQSVKILWYDWCQIHTLMWQSNWCEIHTLMQQCDWCKQHATICANTKSLIFFSLIQKRLTKKHHQESLSHWSCLLQKKRQSNPALGEGIWKQFQFLGGGGEGAGNKTSQSSKSQMPGEKGCWFKLWTDRQISKMNTLARWLISNGIRLSGVLFSL